MLVGSNINVMPRIVAYHTQSITIVLSHYLRREHFEHGYSVAMLSIPCRPSGSSCPQNFSALVLASRAMAHCGDGVSPRGFHYFTRHTIVHIQAVLAAYPQKPVPNAKGHRMPGCRIVDDLGPCAKTIPGIHSIITGCEGTIPVHSLGAVCRHNRSHAHSGEFMLKMRTIKGGHALFGADQDDVVDWVIGNGRDGIRRQPRCGRFPVHCPCFQIDQIRRSHSLVGGADPNTPRGGHNRRQVVAWQSRRHVYPAPVAHVVKRVLT